MELADLGNVAEDDVPLAAQSLGEVVAVHLRHVIVDDELEGSNIVAFGLDHFRHQQI